MDFITSASTAGPAAAFVAGIASIISPCVLPLLPAILAYSSNNGKYRPIAIILGLSISFTLMGIITSAFSAGFQAYRDYIYLVAEIVIIGLGLVMLLEFNIFNNALLDKFSSKRLNNNGLLGGLVLGISLGIIWIPCVGPILGAILTMVAVGSNIIQGGFLLFIYSMGFAVPMLIIAYSANITTSKLGKISKYGIYVKKAAGIVLISIGLWMIYTNHISTYML
ncbi:cytochrome c biogenesis protein transmembrane region [Methanohalobium evestigatum Z-7303]|uniref:Cytochrome c biogenesis protein transmembrane region n=1 Tax=Methanohalobium evestigatum (strain ATCC BAA-1072 / DSM 3721 / NBRC 107634 / OCM 161 / Z-7303) TaxID=644295 RepID=D7E617_METEZ|nr:cytochrome c biogenesis CcdA family protein [Methanohalobium evestigatum]ADI73039.1 cytochrome c biogenesis protein transmembrane region [Methanohalobium evestigatum Z-7303]